MGAILKKFEERVEGLRREIKAKNAELESLKQKRQEAVLSGDMDEADKLAVEIEACERKLIRLRESLAILESQRVKVAANEQEISQILSEWERRVKLGKRLTRRIEAYRKAVEKLAAQLRELDQWHVNAYRQLEKLGIKSVEDGMPSWPIPEVDRTIRNFVTKSAASVW
ncbi:MAG: hypothetical protein QXF61_10340 [Nitrososphaeria archaeon]